MKKKIITLALAVVMCLSVITSVTAADTLNRVASTIPGTDIEYNYVENVTVQIPGTDVTFELEKVSEKVGISSNGDLYPTYIFDFYEEDSKVTFNQEGTASVGSWWWVSKEDNMAMGEYAPEDYDYSYVPGSSLTHNINGSNGTYCTNILENGTSTSFCDNGKIIASIEFHFNEEEGYEWKEALDISNIAVFDEAPSYSIIEGANSVVNSNSLTIKADGEFSKFTGVKVDGEIVDSSNYTATEGSTIIEFKADYLKTLDAGEHTVSVVFTDGEATTQFEIKEDKNTNNNTNENNDNLVTDVEIPNTDYNTLVAAAFVAMSLSGVALVGLKKKK